MSLCNGFGIVASPPTKHIKVGWTGGITHYPDPGMGSNSESNGVTKTNHHMTNSDNDGEFNTNPNQTQACSFVNPADKSVDVNLAYKEAMKRATAAGQPNYDQKCPFERYTDLITENGVVTPETTKAGLTALECEMRGLVKDVHRCNYGEGILGPDFKATGLGKYEGVTHLEVTSPVSSDILKAAKSEQTIKTQGTRIGKKKYWQARFWSNHTKVKEVMEDRNGLVVNYENLPVFRNSTAIAVDFTDMPDLQEQNDFTTAYYNNNGQSLLKTRTIFLHKDNN